MSVLVTGGTGFVGSYVTRRLVQAGQDVVVFDRYPVEERIADVLDDVTLVRGDVLEVQEVVEAIDRFGVERIAHLAFLPGFVQEGKMLPYLRTQCLGTATVFDCARLRGIKRVVTASSVAVYGEPSDRPATEEDPVAPGRIYAVCKQWCEHLGRLYNETEGMEIVHFRLCATLGIGRLNRASLAAGLTGDRVHFMAYPELAALGHPVTMPPDEQVTDVLYAPDAAEAWWLALSVERPAHHVYNLRAERRTVGEMTAHLRALLPEASIAVSDEPIRRLQLMDTTRLVEDLGFVPRYTLEQGLDDYVAQVRRRRPA